jgi:ligand-binding SRPBCC domain-containing protein
MKLILKITVPEHYQTIAAGFNKKLFLALAPPFPPIKLLKFDGCQTNDIVHLQLLGGIDWASKITEHGATSQEIWFVDQGTTLPFFLRSWVHRHRIINQQNNTLIIEDINYKTPFLWLDYLLYPLLWLQFAYRIPIYKRYNWKNSPI